MSLSSTESSLCYIEACEAKKKACGAIFIGIPTQRKPLWGERWHAKTSIKTVHCCMLCHVLPHLTAKQSVFLHIQVVSQTVKQKVWSEAENREWDWGKTLKLKNVSLFSLCKACALHAFETVMLNWFWEKSRLFRSLLRHLFIHHFPAMKSSHTESQIGHNKFVSNLRQKV